MNFIHLHVNQYKFSLALEVNLFSILVQLDIGFDEYAFNML